MDDQHFNAFSMLIPGSNGHCSGNEIEWNFCFKNNFEPLNCKIARLCLKKPGFSRFGANLSKPKLDLIFHQNLQKISLETSDTFCINFLDHFDTVFFLYYYYS